MSDKKVKVFIMGLDDRGKAMKGHTLEIEPKMSSFKQYIGDDPIFMQIPTTNIYIAISLTRTVEFSSHQNVAFYMNHDIHAIFRGTVMFCRNDVDLNTIDHYRDDIVKVMTDIQDSDIEFILAHFLRACEMDGHLYFVKDHELGGYNYMERFNENKRFKELTDMLMKPVGKSDTVGGELVRAVNRICGRYYNDGDVIGCGCGNESCNPAGRYILQYGNYGMQRTIEVLWNGRVRNASDAMWSASYELLLSLLVEETVKYLDSGAEELNKETPDMCDFSLNIDSEYDE